MKTSKILSRQYALSSFFLVSRLAAHRSRSSTGNCDNETPVMGIPVILVNQPRVKPAKNHSAKVLTESAVGLATIFPRLVATWKRKKSLTVARSGAATPSPSQCQQGEQT